MAIDVIMPKMGESITEGTILEWKKNIGDLIAKDETLLEISTDKVDSEVPSPAEGILLECVANVNDVVEVGNVIARIGEKGEILEKPNNAENIKDIGNEDKINVEESVTKPTEAIGERQFYSPLVKSIAKKENISDLELCSIVGTGNFGRVTKKDILQFLDSRNTQSETITTHPPTSIKSLSEKIEPMDRVRSKIAEHMVNSVKTSPHVYSISEVDVTALVNARKNWKDKYAEKHRVKLTYTPMILDACISAIREFPLINASLDGNNIIHHRNINMGVAVALTDNNLIVPVIKASEEKNFLGLARSTAELASRARINKLEPDEIFGSTFTVTNPGVFGSLFGMGIINQPNVAILSVGSIHKRPVVKETEFGDIVAIRSMMYITLGYDHRLIDGAYGTLFLSKVAELLESFDEKRLSL